MSKRWVTIEKAGEETGLPMTFFHERTGISGVWPEGQVWKWFEGRKLIDLQELYVFIDRRPSIQSTRGRRRSATPCPVPAPNQQPA